jgi:hypothetical protein
LTTISANFFSTVLPALQTVYMDADTNLNDDTESCISTFVVDDNAAIKALPGSVPNTCVIIN